jgi:NAD-dependent SIR2 family protein deacetylase
MRMAERLPIYSYPKRRAALLILGAGASHADGLPLQRDLLPFILTTEDQELAGSASGAQVRDFVTTWFSISPETEAFPTLEEVFGFIDVAIVHSVDLSATWTVEALGHVRRSLEQCIHFAIHHLREGYGHNYAAMWQTLDQANHNVSIVTLNYDSSMEEAFDPLFPNSLIDYCLPFMNYEAPPGVDAFDWWVNPRDPSDYQAQGAQAYKILKLHGSLNWRYCRSCRGVLLTPWNTEIDLAHGHFSKIEYGAPAPVITEKPLTCPYCQTSFEGLVLPPSYVKNLSHPVVSALTTEAVREAQIADRAIFIGYSFPSADVHVKALLARCIRTTSVKVIDPWLSNETKARYASVSDDVEFIEAGFEDVISSGRFADLIEGNA